MRFNYCFSDDACIRIQLMEGLRRVVVGSAVGGLLGAAAFFAAEIPTGATPNNWTCSLHT